MTITRRKLLALCGILPFGGFGLAKLLEKEKRAPIFYMMRRENKYLVARDWMAPGHDVWYNIDFRLRHGNDTYSCGCLLNHVCREGDVLLNIRTREAIRLGHFQQETSGSRFRMWEVERSISNVPAQSILPGDELLICGKVGRERDGD